MACGSSSKHRYELFVSYSRADREWVEGYLLDALTAAKVDVTSELNFELGAPRMVEFERAVKRSRRTLLVLSPAYMAEAALQFVDVIVQHYGLESGTWPVIPLLLRPVELPPRLAMLVALDLTDQATWADGVERLCGTLQVEPPEAPGRPTCPYPGMRAFREEETKYFHGRESEVDELVQRLRANRFLAVIGPSGSGKSSLVSAGLIPALRGSGLFGPGEWFVRRMRPGAEPLTELVRLLGAESLEAFARETLFVTQMDAGRLLVVVDQFEEAFTQGSAGKEDFFAAIQRLVTLPNCHVVITVRSDFFTDLLSSAMWPLVQGHRLEIAPLGEKGLRSAIVKPAEGVGVYVEAALVERLVGSSAGQPGVLPFVQEVMVRLWEKLERRFLPLRAYEALILPSGKYGGSEKSGIQAAMAQVADEMVNRLPAEQQAISKRVLLRLVQFGEGRADTRRQQPVTALRSAGENADLFERTLNYLTQNRLISMSGEETGESHVDLAHETMIVGWPMLSQWIRQHRGPEIARRRLEQRAQEWIATGCGERGLLTEEDLGHVRQELALPEARQLGITVDVERWVEACGQHVARRRRQRLALSAALTITVISILVSVALRWATDNPVFSGWHAVTAPEEEAQVDLERSLVRMDRPSYDRIFFLDSVSDRIYRSENGGQSWTAVHAGAEDGQPVDLAPHKDSLCVLYTASMKCYMPNGDISYGRELRTPEGAQAIALAADPGGEYRFAVGYSDGSIDVSSPDGDTWSTLREAVEIGALIRLGFSGDSLLALMPKSVEVINLRTGESREWKPEPEWQEIPLDLAVPSSLGRFLVALGDGGIVDADLSGSQWFSFTDPPPTGAWSLDSADVDSYVVGPDGIYCNRFWTWRNTDWWRFRLGLATSCSD